MGALAVFIPLLTVFVSGVLEYQRGKSQERDVAFRVIVDDLVAAEIPKRRAAASKLGMFVDGGDQYSRVAADLLVSALAFEEDYGVLHAIRGSLVRTQNKIEYARIINALLRLQANIGESALLPGANEEQLRAQDMIVQNSVTMLLRDRPDLSGGLKFFNNAITHMLLYELRITDSELKSVAFHNQNLNRTQFDHSTIATTTFNRTLASRASFRDTLIEHSLFYYADLRQVDFSGATLREVFFKGSDLAGATFVDASIETLTPYHFCYTSNLNLATFRADPVQNAAYVDRLVTQVQESCDANDFAEYVRSRLLLATIENALLASPGVDTDGDGTWDEYDLDDDNDGIWDTHDPFPLIPGPTSDLL
jgi:uncharacterized protein YjbI with pentapeptide repeats